MEQTLEQEFIVELATRMIGLVQETAKEIFDTKEECDNYVIDVMNRGMLVEKYNLAYIKKFGNGN